MPPRLPIIVALAVVVLSPQPVQLEIEWLTLSPSAQPRVERRTEAVGQRISIDVDDVENRFVRFIRRGASPITVPAKTLLAQPTWPLPDPQAGGEFLGLIAPAAIRPIAYQLSGARVFDLRQ